MPTDPLPEKRLQTTIGDARAMEGFQTFAEALPGMVWTADASGAPVWFAHDFYPYTGLTAEHAAAAGWIGCVHPDRRASIAAKFAQCVSTGSAFESLIPLRGAAGTHRWFSVQARPFRDAAGEITAWLGTLTDVDESQTRVDANAHVLNALMQGYLSKPLPVVRGLSFDTRYQTANAMERPGGDWYDVFELPNGRIGFSLGDVCGHGIDAAVKMSEAKQAIFVAASLRDPEPRSVLYEANKVLFLNNHRVSITTAVYGFVDTARRTVSYASAGHHPPILVRADGETEILPNHGFPLGVEEHMPPRIRTHQFEYESGSTMVMYTDGLIEFDHDLAKGEARLLAAAGEATRCKTETPAAFIASRVLRGVPSKDDVAVLTISFKAA
jgi:PAS domain S-box-containing protein